MMRNVAVALIASMVLFAGTASANYTIDLIWADTGTATLTVLPGDAAAAAGGDLCSTGFISAAGTGRCMLVRFTAAATFKASISTIGWNTAASGVTVDFAANRSYGQWNGLGLSLAPVLPKVAGTVDCAPGCDSAYGSFGGATAGAIGAGTYTLGSINFNTSGALAGVHSFTDFFRTGVGDVVNGKGVPGQTVQVNGAILNVIPEPGTASLLGLGIMGLVLAGRRRKD